MSNPDFYVLARFSSDFGGGVNGPRTGFGITMLQTFVKIVKSKAAATAIEYGLIAALIAVAAMVAIRGVASETTDMWNRVGSEVTKN